jgi:molybdopterin converting factor small subunit
MTISVRVLLFARYADLLGTEALPLSLSAGATVADAVAAVRALPGGDAIPARPLVAVNLEQRDPDAVLTAGDEVALLPPVAGG